MTDRKKLEDLNDDDLDTAAGGGAGHDAWIPIESVSTPVHRKKADATPTSGVTLNFEEIKTQHKAQT